MIKKIGKWAEKVLTSTLTWVHRIIMFITFPLRRLGSIAGIIAAAALLFLILHLYYGIRFERISQWYNTLFPAKAAEQKIDNASSDIFNRVEQIEKSVSAAVKADVKDNHATAEDSVGKKHFAAWKVPEFKKAKYHTQKEKTVAPAEPKKYEPSAPIVNQEKAENAVVHTVTVEKELTITTPEVENKVKKNKPLIELPKISKKITAPQVEKPYVGKITDYYKVMENANLAYLSEPISVSGAAEVFGPNSLYVDNVFMFLYGIYSDAAEFDLKEAQKYLEKLTAKKTVHCEIVAYATHTQTATAICFADGVFINRDMVGEGLARNVSLK